VNEKEDEREFVIVRGVDSPTNQSYESRDGTHRMSSYEEAQFYARVLVDKFGIPRSIWEADLDGQWIHLATVDPNVEPIGPFRPLFTCPR
jgi:hypothetical protein